MRSYRQNAAGCIRQSKKGRKGMPGEWKEFPRDRTEIRGQLPAGSYMGEEIHRAVGGGPGGSAGTAYRSAISPYGRGGAESPDRSADARKRYAAIGIVTRNLTIRSAQSVLCCINKPQIPVGSISCRPKSAVAAASTRLCFHYFFLCLLDGERFSGRSAF